MTLISQETIGNRAQRIAFVIEPTSLMVSPRVVVESSIGDILIEHLAVANIDGTDCAAWMLRPGENTQPARALWTSRPVTAGSVLTVADRQRALRMPPDRRFVMSGAGMVVYGWGWSITGEIDT